MDNQSININKCSKSVVKCRQKNNDVVQLLLPKGYREKIKAVAKAEGISMNELIKKAITAYIEQSPSTD